VEANHYRRRVREPQREEADVTRGERIVARKTWNVKWSKVRD